MPVDQSLRSFGFTYGQTGYTRGTTTSTGIFVVNTGFARRVVSGFGDDASTHLFQTQTGGGPASTQSTYFFFQFATVNTNSPTQARFRVRRLRIQKGVDTVATNLYLALATTVSGVELDWTVFGY